MAQNVKRGNHIRSQKHTPPKSLTNRVSKTGCVTLGSSLKQNSGARKEQPEGWPADRAEAQSPDGGAGDAQGVTPP
eukprot:scaffold7342_cov117-Isochrysis_galbana.AAC.1